MKALVHLARASLLGFVRDRAALAWTLAFPVGLLALFSVMFTGGSSGPRPGEPAGSPTSYLLPAILAMALMQLGIYSAVTLVQHRERRILKRLATAPIDRWSVVGSFVGARLVVAIGQVAVMVVAGYVIAGTRISGNPLLVAAVVVLVASTFIAMGFALAGVARTEEAATSITGLVTLPMMFLSGVFVPVEQLPDVVRPIASVLPMTYAADALRQVMTGGVAFVPLWVAVAVLAGWLVMSMAAATRLFRWS